MKKFVLVVAVFVALFFMSLLVSAATFNFYWDSFRNYEPWIFVYDWEDCENLLLIEEVVGLEWLEKNFVDGEFANYLHWDTHPERKTEWEENMALAFGSNWQTRSVYLVMYYWYNEGWQSDPQGPGEHVIRLVWVDSSTSTSLDGQISWEIKGTSEDKESVFKVRGASNSTRGVRYRAFLNSDTYQILQMNTTSSFGVTLRSFKESSWHNPEFMFLGAFKYNHVSDNVPLWDDTPPFQSPFEGEQHKTAINECYFFTDDIRGYQYISGMSTYPWAGRLDRVEQDVQEIWGEHYAMYYFTKWVETSPTYQAAGGVAYHSQSYVVFVSTEGEEELDLCVKSDGERIILTSNKPYVLVTPFTVVHRRMSAPYVWQSSPQYHANIISAGEYLTTSTSVPGDWTQPPDYSPPQDEIDFYTDDNQLVETIMAILRFGFVPGATRHEPGIDTSYLETALGDLVKPIVEIVNVFHEIAEFEPTGFPEIMILGVDISPGIVDVLERPVEFWGLNSSLSNVLKSLFTVGMIGMFIRWLMGKGKNVASGGTK